MRKTLPRRKEQRRRLKRLAHTARVQVDQDGKRPQLVTRRMANASGQSPVGRLRGRSGRQPADNLR